MPPNLSPVGYGGGVQLTRALVDVGRMRLGVGGDFAYQRIPRASDEYLSHTTFAALLVLDGIFGRVRPWLGVGAGLSVAQYRKPRHARHARRIDVDTVAGARRRSPSASTSRSPATSTSASAPASTSTFSSLDRRHPPVQAFQPGLFSARLGVGFRF